MQNQAIQNQYLINFSTKTNEQMAFALKDQPQLPYFIDIFSRKESHHLLLENAFSNKILPSLLDAIALQLKSNTTPIKLQEAEVIYLATESFNLLAEKKAILSPVQQLIQQTNATNKKIIFALSDMTLLHDNNAQQPLNDLNQLLQTKLLDDNWRFLVFTTPEQTITSSNKTLFSTIRLDEPSNNETLAILKTFCSQLESYHQIIIPEEIFSYALSLAAHYLGGKSPLEKALELLDSSAAHTSAQIQAEQTSPLHLTTAALAETVSKWCHIPLSHLHHNKFKLSQLLPYLQQKILGQNFALNTIGLLLQTTCIPLNKNSRTLCNLLLAGPNGVGKKEFAIALAEYLFTNQAALLHILPLQKHQTYSLANVSTLSHNTKAQYLSLLTAIQNKPYAIIYFDNINESSAEFIELFKDIFTQGYTYDEQGNFYDFRHTIILLNTTLGADQINNLTIHHKKNHQTQATDLMQLVLNEPANQTDTEQSLSEDEITQQILPCLTSCFSAEILSHLHIIPFVPLEQTTLETIISQKIMALAKSLEKDFGITLVYATEVIKFLSHEIMKQKSNAHTLNKQFEYYIYSKIANEVLARINDANKPKRLALLLNDSGQLLRCEFIKTNESATQILC